METLAEEGIFVDVQFTVYVRPTISTSPPLGDKTVITRKDLLTKTKYPAPTTRATTTITYNQNDIRKSFLVHIHRFIY